MWGVAARKARVGEEASVPTCEDAGRVPFSLFGRRAQSVPKRSFRYSEKAGTEEIVASVKWFLEHIGDLAEQLRRRSAEATRQAEDARQLVASYVFPQEDELREAERRLQEVNLQISDMALKDNPAA